MFFLELTKEETEKFESEFNSSKGLNRYLPREKHHQDFSINYFINFSVTKDVVVDGITKMGLISDESVIELSYGVINKYDVYYKTERRREQKLNFVHVISIYCKPDLIISLHGERYDWRATLGGGQGDDILNQFKVNRNVLLPQAQKILNMCEQKYAYGELVVD